MPGWLKIILAILGICVLVLIGLGVTGYFYFKQHSQEWKQASEAAGREGEAFAQGKDESQCVDEALRRVAKCGGLPCEIAVNRFLSSCLPKATRSPELCKDIPPQSELIRSARWALEECGRRGQPGSQPCARLMQELQGYCTPHR